MYIGNPYKVLGVADGSSIDNCKKAYRRLCKLYHPDTGGDAEKFDAVNKAFEAIQNKSFLNTSATLQRHRLTHTSLFSYAVV